MSHEVSVPLHVLRLCSVFEPESAAVRAAGFDPIGGMQNHTATLSRCLDARGITQTVVTSRLGGSRGTTPVGARARVTREGIRIRRLRQLWALLAVPHVLRPQRPVDVVHAHQGEDVGTLLLATLARLVHRCPLVVTVHSSVQFTVRGRGPRMLLLRTVGALVERLVLRRSDAVIVLAQRTHGLLRASGLPPDRLHVIPSGYDPELFAGDVADTFPGLPRPRIGYVGRLAAAKRADLLVEAFAGVRDDDARLVIVGHGPERARIEATTAGSPLSDRVTITGFVPHEEIPAVLRSLDILVLPSVYEELGSVLIEAMAAGLPVVASRVDGIPEVVLDGKTGLPVPAGDVEALTLALDTLLADAGLRAQMAAGARARAGRYAWPDLASKVASVYEDLTRHGRERAAGARASSPRQRVMNRGLE